MLNVTIIGDRQIIQRLGGMSPALRTALEKTVTRWTVKLQGYVVSQKLHGQVLHQRSGKLVASIQRKVDAAGSHVYGFVYSSGDVKYAARWEFGFTGTEHVRAHERTIHQAFGRAIAARSVHVNAFSRKIDSAARPFLRPSLEEHAEEIGTDLRETVIGAMRAQVMGGGR